MNWSLKSIRFISSLSLSCVILLLVFSACSESPIVSNEPLTFEQQIALTPRANAEAENMALLLSGELVAPEYLYRNLEGELQEFRDRFRDSLPFVDTVGYLPYTPTNEIRIMLSDSAKEELRVGNYFGIDSLNELFKGQMTDTAGMFDTTVNRPDHILLTFDGRYDPRALSHIYSKAPGVGGGTLVGISNGGSSLLPGEINGSRVFLVQKLWWFANHQCYYFTERSSGFELVASWGSDGGQIPTDLEAIVAEMREAYLSGTY